MSILILIFRLDLFLCILTAVGAKHKGVETALVPQMVEHRDVGVHVVDVVGVGRVLAVCPLVRGLQGMNNHLGVREVLMVLTVTSVSNIAFSGFDSSSTLSKPITYCSKG